MFQFGGFPSCNYGFIARSTVLHRRGFPIRKSAGQSLFPANRGLSQVVTSFFGSWCQGIHLMLFFAWTALFLVSLFRKLASSCLSFANNCLGCELKRPCFWFHCFPPEPLGSNGKIVFPTLFTERPSNLKSFLSEHLLLKNLPYNYLCFVSFLYSVFNEHLPTPCGVGRPKPRPQKIAYALVGLFLVPSLSFRYW